MTSKLTRERIELIANFHRAMTLPPSHDEIEELARMAMVAMDSAMLRNMDDEIIAEIEGREKARRDGIRKCIAALRYHHKRAEACSNGYTGSTLEDDTLKSINFLKSKKHRPPAPVVPEEATPGSIEILASARRRDHAVFQWDEDQRNAAADSWNAFRAAMLQAVNSPVIGIDQATGADKTVEVRYVAPPGYVMVPKEPTKEMIDAGWLHYMATKNPSSKGTYKAMLAAAPQEVK
ncbi:hypothetical protein R4R75_003326 [Klebsiella michiganensis]|nr:hypothetical protein [Klebsiella michiganensis]